VRAFPATRLHDEIEAASVTEPVILYLGFGVLDLRVTELVDLHLFPFLLLTHAYRYPRS
jgi:hypothetical protein